MSFFMSQIWMSGYMARREMLELSDEKGAEFHATDDKRQTVLHEAVRQGDLQISQSLLLTAIV